MRRGPKTPGRPHGQSGGGAQRRKIGYTVYTKRAFARGCHYERPDMEPRFAIVDRTQEHFLLISQYLDLGWPQADVEEYGAEALFAGAIESVDAIILVGFDDSDDKIQGLLQPPKSDERPFVILLRDNGRPTKQPTDNILPLKNLSAAALNGALAEGVGRRSGAAKPAEPAKRRPLDGELPIDKLKKLLRGYKLLRELGRGGMAVVYLAENAAGQHVAVKVLDVSDNEDDHDRSIERFIREYSMLGSVRSAHVARILDQIFTDEYAFIIMEHLSGGDLGRRIRRGLQPGQALRYLEQIAQGLREVHEKGIVHRDLKPSNIMFRADETLTILDFGLAHMRLDENLSKPGEVYGTPSYVSPEQARGKRVDLRSDIYSLGIVFYQMLTGKKPYRADNSMAVFYKHINEQIPQLPAPLAKYQALLEKMLAKSPAERFQNTAELTAAARALA